MTKVERLEKELEKLHEYRRVAIKRNDLFWLSLNVKKIAEKEAELEQAKLYQPVRLSQILDDKGKEVKDAVYKALLKISLAADFANDCAEDAKELLAKLGLNDFSLRADVDSLREMSQKIASFVIIPNQKILEDMIVDNSEFVDSCHEAADKHLKEKLSL